MCELDGDFQFWDGIPHWRLRKKKNKYISNLMEMCYIKWCLAVQVNKVNEDIIKLSDVVYKTPRNLYYEFINIYVFSYHYLGKLEETVKIAIKTWENCQWIRFICRPLTSIILESGHTEIRESVFATSGGAATVIIIIDMVMIGAENVEIFCSLCTKKGKYIFFIAYIRMFVG